MSWVAVGAAAVGLGTSVYKGVQAKKQAKAAQEKLEKMELPSTQTEEYKQNIAAAKARAQGGLPEASYLREKDAIAGSLAAGVDVAKTGNMGLGALPGMIQSATGAYSDLISKDALARQQQQDRLSELRSAQSDREYQQKMAQYQANVASQQAMLGAGIQNQQAAFDEGTAFAMQGAGAAAEHFQGKKNNVSFDQYNKMTPEEQQAYQAYMASQGNSIS